MLRSAEPYERSYLGVMYFRGQAFLLAGQPEAARSEFEKIIALRSADAFVLDHALARLGLARAHAASGDSAAAIHAYQDFFDFWSDADPDLPIYQQAQAEYAALQEPPRG